MHPAPTSSALVAASLMLAQTTYAQIPPNFSPSSSEQLELAYGPGMVNTRVVQPGDFLPYADGLSIPPIIGLSSPPADSAGPFLVTMIDPDARYPQNPTESQILHWLQSNLYISNTTGGLFPNILQPDSDPVVPFFHPQPPANSTAHRYIQYLWEQPADFTVPAAFSGFSASNRSHFDVAAFAAAAGLTGPIAANYFLTSMMNMTSTGPTTATGTGAPTSTPTGIMPFDPNAAARSNVGGVAALVGGAAVLCAALL